MTPDAIVATEASEHIAIIAITDHNEIRNIARAFQAAPGDNVACAPRSRAANGVAPPTAPLPNHSEATVDLIKRIAAARSTPVLLGSDAIPAGLFRNPANCDLAAVLFSNAMTTAKFNRMGFLTGIKPPSLTITRRGYIYDRTPEALEPIGFDYGIVSAEYAAIWPNTRGTLSLEIEVFHNPLAWHPLPFDVLPECTNWFEHEGKIICRAFHEYTALATMTKLGYSKAPPDHE